MSRLVQHVINLIMTLTLSGCIRPPELCVQYKTEIDNSTGKPITFCTKTIPNPKYEGNK